MSREQLLKEVYVKGKAIQHDPIDISQASIEIENAYNQRIQDDIKAKTKILQQSKVSCGKLREKEHMNPISKLDKLKAETVGLHEALRRVPYVQERGDAIGIALSINDLKNQSDGSVAYIDYLNERSATLNKDIILQQAVLADYTELEKLLETHELNELSKSRETAKGTIKRIGTKIDQHLTREDKLMKYLKVILTEYLGKILWNDKNYSDAEKYSSAAEGFKLVEALLNAMSNPEEYDDGYIEVVDSSNPLLRQLLKGDFITEKDNFSRVKLRSFGFGFEHDN